MHALLVACLLCLAPLLASAADTVADIEVLAASLDSPPLQFRVRAHPASGHSSANATERDPNWIAAAHARFADSRAADTGWYGLTLTIADARSRSPRVNDSVAMGAAGFGEGALTGELVCDQSMPGLHLSFGKTYATETGAEWDSQAQVVAAQAFADIDLDGVPLLRAGRYLV